LQVCFKALIIGNVMITSGITFTFVTRYNRTQWLKFFSVYVCVCCASNAGENYQRDIYNACN